MTVWTPGESNLMMSGFTILTSAAGRPEEYWDTPVWALYSGGIKAHKP